MDTSEAAGRQALFYSALPPALATWLRDLAIETSAAGTPIYLVGGAVRDLLLGRSPLDLDLVLAGDALGWARRLAARQGWRVTGHAAFGTATIHLPAELAPLPPANPGLDFVTARRETYPQPGQLPLIMPADLPADLARRDFTINAMALALDPSAPTLLDPHGGQADLEAEKIRVLHKDSFRDDPTRILRAARYAARFEFRVAPQTAGWITESLAAGMLDQLTPARIWHELARTLAEATPGPALALLQAWGVPACIAPGLQWEAGWAGDLRCTPDPALRLALWLAHLPPTARAGSAGRLNQSSRPADELAALSAGAPTLPGAGPIAVVAALRPFPAPILALARCLAPKPVAAVLDRYINEWQHITPRLTGDDLRALGLPPGPQYRLLLDTLRDARLEGRLESRADEVAFVHAWLEAQALLG